MEKTEPKITPIPTVEKKPEERQTGKETIYAYEINDKAFGIFKALNTANGWWLDRIKLDNLISAYKIDCTDEEACAYAGISLAQYKYFKELHPEFSDVKSACKQLPFLKARKTINEGLNEVENARWYMERKKKSEFSARTELSGPEGEGLNPIEITIVEPKIKAKEEENGDSIKEDKSNSSILKEPEVKEKDKSE